MSSVRWTPLIISLVTLIVYLDTHSLHPFLASYARELGAAPLMVGIIVAAYSLAEDSFEAPLGYIMDKIGKRKFLLMVGLIADAAAMIAYSFSRIPEHLLLSRVFHGFGGAIAGPAIMSLVADVPHPLARMGARMGLYGSTIGISVIIGWVLGGILVARIGYEALFYSVSFLLIFVALLTVFIVEPPPFALPETQRRLSVRELFSRAKELFRRRGFTVACFAIFTHMMSMGAMVTLLSGRFGELGFPPKEIPLYIGMTLATYGICWVLFQVPCGSLSDRIGRKPSLLLGLAIVSISMAILSQVPELRFIVPIAGLYGAGYALLFPTVTSLVAESAELKSRALGSGIFHLLFTQGVVVGAPLFSFIAGTYGYSMGLMSSSLAPLSALIVALIVLR